MAETPLCSFPPRYAPAAGDVTCVTAAVSRMQLIILRWAHLAVASAWSTPLLLSALPLKTSRRIHFVCPSNYLFTTPYQNTLESKRYVFESR